MSKQKTSSSKETYKYPSHFGSHSSMIDEAETAKLTDPLLVACLDEFGVYITERKKLDDRSADPNRYVGKRLEGRLL